MLGDESKVLAQLYPHVRLGHPAIVGMNGMVLGQLPGNEPVSTASKMGKFELEHEAIRWNMTPGFSRHKLKGIILSRSENLTRLRLQKKTVI